MFTSRALLHCCSERCKPGWLRIAPCALCRAPCASPPPPALFAVRCAACGLRLAACGLQLAPCASPLELRFVRYVFASHTSPTMLICVPAVDRPPEFAVMCAACALRLAPCALRFAPCALACDLRLVACGLRLVACGLRLAPCASHFVPRASRLALPPSCALCVAFLLATSSQQRAYPSSPPQVCSQVRGLRIAPCALRLAPCALRLASCALRFVLHLTRCTCCSCFRIARVAHLVTRCVLRVAGFFTKRKGMES